MRYIKVILLVLIFFFFAIFVVQNHGLLGQEISFRLDLIVIPPLESIPLPLYLVLLVTLVLGALVCVLFLAGDRIKMTFALHRANKRINVLEQEVASLRALPLTGAYKAPSSTANPKRDEQKNAAPGSTGMPTPVEVTALPEDNPTETEKTDEEKSGSVAKL